MTLMKPVSTPSVLIVLASNAKFHAPFATSDFFSHISSKLYQMCVCVGVCVHACGCLNKRFYPAAHSSGHLLP